MSIGLFEASKSYSAVQIAKLLGNQQAEWKQVRWVEKEVFGKGCPHRTIGNTHVATGASLNAWIDSASREAAEEEGEVSAGPPPVGRIADSMTAPASLPFITAQALADQLGLSKRTVMSHFVRKRSPGENGRACPHVKLGTEIYFVVERVKEWLDEQANGVAGPVQENREIHRVDQGHTTGGAVAMT